jgi:hypothetical protein
METVFFFFQVKQQQNRMRLKQRIKVSFFLNKRVSKVNFKIFLLIVKKRFALLFDKKYNESRNRKQMKG